MNANAQRLKWCIDRINAQETEIGRLNGVIAAQTPPAPDPDELALDAQVDALIAANPDPALSAAGPATVVTPPAAR